MRKIVFISLIFCVSIFAKEIYATFDCVAFKSANVAFSSSGIVDDVKVDIGSKVKKGDILATLNSDDIKANIDITNSNLFYAKRDLDRQNKIKNMIDEAKYDTYKKTYYNLLYNQKYQQTLLDKTILKAPFDGVITSKEIESGDVVSGQMIKTAFKIQSETKRKLVLQFDQKYYQDVKIGDKFTYKIDTDTKEYSGVISKIYPYANSTNRKIKAEVITSNLLVGLFGDGYITTKSE